MNCHLINRHSVNRLCINCHVLNSHRPYYSYRKIVLNLLHPAAKVTTPTTPSDLKMNNFDTFSTNLQKRVLFSETQQLTGQKIYVKLERFDNNKKEPILHRFFQRKSTLR